MFDLESHVTGAFLCPVCDVRFSSKASCSTHLFRAHKVIIIKLTQSLRDITLNVLMYVANLPKSWQGWGEK